ncbi:MAG TPA: hypothetical protein VH140_03625 [Candidatus Acidoferrum sp.]|jgi:hypothetical protein|nr:hypothetical protein [Candidatus Acidoferrum sp.]
MMSKHPSVRVVLYLAAVLTLSGILFAQSTSNKTLVVNGKTASAGVRQINGRLYIDLETLAQATNAVFTVEPRRVVLTIPPADAGAVATDDSAQNSQRLSRDFASAAISALANMREWRVAVRAMILYGLAVSDTWVQAYHNQTLDAIRQAGVAASTDADKNALQLLQNEADSMTAWANQVDSARQQLNGARTVDPNTLQNDPTLAKLQKCSQFLNSMVLSGTFNDDPSCH